MLPVKLIVDAMVNWSQSVLEKQVPGTARQVHEYADAMAFQCAVPVVVCEGWLENRELEGGYFIRLAPAVRGNMPTHYIAAFPDGDNEMVVYVQDNLMKGNAPELAGVFDPGLNCRMFIRAIVNTQEDASSFVLFAGSKITTQCLAFYNANNPIHYIDVES